MKNLEPHPTDTLTREEQVAVMLRDLYDKALGGNNVARKMWFELTGKPEIDQTFNLRVDIAPYTIADKSLKAIAQEATTEFVDQIFEGIAVRLREDKAPQRLITDFEQFWADYDAWADVTYKPKDHK